MREVGVLMDISFPYLIHMDEMGIITVYHNIICRNCYKNGEMGIYQAFVRMDFVSSEGRCFNDACPICREYELHIIV